MSKIAKMHDVSGCSIDELLCRSGTDWDVDVQSVGGDFRRLARPDTDTPLAFVGKSYAVNSHRAQLRALDTLVESREIQPTTVSVWDNGAILAYQFRCPNLDVVIRGQDVVSPLLTLAFSYGSKLTDSAFFADFRWFCKNQMGQVANLNKEGRVGHRGAILGRFADVVDARIHELGQELGDRYGAMRRMTGVGLSGKALSAYFGASVGCTPAEIEAAWVTPPEDLRGDSARIPEILDCYMVDDAGAEGTVWQAYNAVTRYETHKVGRTEETRNRRMLLGSGNVVSNNAFGLARRLAA
jgi:hypothetical protein